MSGGKSTSVKSSGITACVPTAFNASCGLSGRRETVRNQNGRHIQKHLTRSGCTDVLLPMLHCNQLIDSRPLFDLPGGNNDGKPAAGRRGLNQTE